MFGLEARGLDGFLRTHVEVDDIEQHLQHCLILVVPARGGHGEVGLAVFNHQRGAERHAGTFAGRELIRVARRGDERLQPGRERNARITGNHRWQPRAARRCGENVAILIDDVHTRSVVDDSERCATGWRG